jgi:hypothetical protein
VIELRLDASLNALQDVEVSLRTRSTLIMSGGVEVRFYSLILLLLSAFDAQRCGHSGRALRHRWCLIRSTIPWPLILIPRDCLIACRFVQGEKKDDKNSFARATFATDNFSSKGAFARANIA